MLLQGILPSIFLPPHSSIAVDRVSLRAVLLLPSNLEVWSLEHHTALSSLNADASLFTSSIAATMDGLFDFNLFWGVCTQGGGLLELELYSQGYSFKTGTIIMMLNFMILKTVITKCIKLEL